MKKTILVLALSVSTPAMAEFLSGNSLWSRMNGAVEDKMLAIGFVMGVHDVQDGITHCSPDNVTAGQVRDVVYAAMSKIPQYRHLAAQALIIEALRVTWPCANKPQKNRSGT